LWTICCLKKAKNQQSNFFCDLPRGQGEIFNDKILLEGDLGSGSESRTEKCVAHSVTQLVINEIHKNWKKTKRDLCAIETRDGRG